MPTAVVIILGPLLFVDPSPPRSLTLYDRGPGVSAQS